MLIIIIQAAFGGQNAGRRITRVLPIVGLDVRAIGSSSLFGFGSGGRNSFEHQNKFLNFKQIMNFGCQAEVFQLPHHRQYLFVACNPFWTHASSAGKTKRKDTLMTENWEKHKWIFEPDGSLLDIYVQETKLVDWLTLIEFLNANFKIKYAPTSENEFDKNINKEYIAELLLDQTGELERRTVSIFSGNLFFNCHFFLEDEIEFDTEPGAIKEQEDFETLVSFMNAVSKVLNKEIILTPENSPKFPLITINQKQGILKILSQDELSKLRKNEITWIGRLRGFYVFSLMRLLPKLKQSKFSNWLADYVVGLTGANRPHIASKKKTN